jgi:uncharacterized protein (DUF433 family)
VIEIAPRIAVDPAVRFGRPVIAGTRVPVDAVLGQLAAGATIDQVAELYGIEPEDVRAVLSYAARALANEQVRAIGS